MILPNNYDIQAYKNKKKHFHADIVLTLLFWEESVFFSDQSGDEMMVSVMVMTCMCSHHQLRHHDQFTNM